MTPGIIFKRLLAFLIDCLIISIPLTLYHLTTTLKGTQQAIEQLSAQSIMNKQFDPGFHIIITFAVFYYMAFECSKWQGSIGKRLLSLRVLNKNDHTLQWWQSLLRSILMYLPSIATIIFKLLQITPNSTIFAVLNLIFVLACFLPIFFTQDRVTLYDMLTGTKVCARLDKNQ